MSQDKRHPPCATCGTPSQFDLCDGCYERRARYILEMLEDARKDAIRAEALRFAIKGRR